jgi:hypothetical protein
VTEARGNFPLAPRPIQPILCPPLKIKGAYWFRLTVGVTGRMPWKPGWPRKIRRAKNINANSNVVDATEAFGSEYALAA